MTSIINIITRMRPKLALLCALMLACCCLAAPAQAEYVTNDALHLGIITVANAYAQLAVEGYITSREKKGYFVEDVSSYRVRRKAAAAMLPEAAEREYFADFKANRISLQNFPLATWTRLMRETLSVHNSCSKPFPTKVSTSCARLLPPTWHTTALWMLTHRR